MQMKFRGHSTLGLWAAVVAAMATGTALAATLPPAPGQADVSPSIRGPGSSVSKGARPIRVYVLQPSDMVDVSVYQEEDMSAKARLEKDGTILLPLLGKVQIGGQTLEGASRIIRERLAKTFLVNPQVTLIVLEFAKRRFTVLGQVQRPGSYEIPSEEGLNLLQAIAIAGGYTRLGAPGKVTVQRRVYEETKTFKLDAEAMSRDPDARSFEIQPDDTITIGERLI